MAVGVEWGGCGGKRVVVGEVVLVVVGVRIVRPAVEVVEEEVRAAVIPCGGSGG